jgi:hypothetical protein
MNNVKYDESQDDKDETLGFDFKNTNIEYKGYSLDDQLEQVSIEPEILNWCKDDEKAIKFNQECGEYVKQDTENSYSELFEICQKKGKY